MTAAVDPALPAGPAQLLQAAARQRVEVPAAEAVEANS